MTEGKGVAVVLVAGRQGAITGLSVASAEEAAAEALSAGIAVELLLVLAAPCDATRAAVAELPSAGWRVIEAESERFDAVAHAALAASDAASFSWLDAGDLWGFDWLREASKIARESVGRTIVHAEQRWRFGDVGDLHVYGDADSGSLDLDCLRAADDRATAWLAPRAAFEIPAADARAWRMALAADGWRFASAPGTIHFERAGQGEETASPDLADDEPLAAYGHPLYAANDAID